MSNMLAVDRSPDVLTVAALNAWIKQRVESDPRLRRVSVVGELSNFKKHTSGHMYFTLKDEQSRIRGIMFAGRNRFLKFMPKDGMRVICTGSIGVFERDGQYQLYVDDMQPDGVGALYIAYTQLRQKLEAEGLFASERKRPLPAFPRRIGVVTSPTGAVIRDICTTLARRFPMTQVILAPALVQGPEAAETIVASLARLAQLRASGVPIDVVIVGRGGGSLEELWPFNDERVARTIAAYPVPVISAVGHETDFTICDFVADVRAATPTAAAELAAPKASDLRQQLAEWAERSKTALGWSLQQQRTRLVTLQSSQALRDPLKPLEYRKQSVDYLETQVQKLIHVPLRQAQARVSKAVERLYRIDLAARIEQARSKIGAFEQSASTQMHRRVDRLNHALERTIAQLDALSPLRVLSRGYSVVFEADSERVVGSVKAVRPGQRVQIQFADGRAKARIESGEEPEDDGEQLRLDL